MSRQSNVQLALDANLAFEHVDMPTRIDAVRRAYDEARIKRVGVASILELTSEQAAARRASRALFTHQADAVGGALEQWWGLYR